MKEIKEMKVKKLNNKRIYAQTNKIILMVKRIKKCLK